MMNGAHPPIPQPPSRPPTPVTVVTGFLGAGKTTLVNRWLADAVQSRDEIAVIVNEHGAIGIDGELLSARVRAVVEISGGCVCCSTQGELVRALAELSSAGPERILVETSGAASPAGVLRAITARPDAHVLDGVVTVVDAARIGSLAEHDLAVEQLGYADVIVLSRADHCDAETLAQARSLALARNGAAVVATAASGLFEDPKLANLAAVLALRRGDFTVAPPASPPAVHVYESVALVVEGDVDGERFADFMESDLARFAGRLFRTKGILALDGVGERMIVQGVADLVEVTFGEPWASAPRSSRLVLVGYGLDRDALERAFAVCAVSSIA